MEKMAHSAFSAITKNSRITGILLIAILLLAAFLRLYKISDYMTFLGDEGRDVLVVRDILQGNFTLLGPRSSAADFFYGPIYYYLITPFLFLFNYDPVGPAIFVALLGVATVFLLYKAAKELLGSEFAGLTAALLYAVSPVVIAYSRSSWNPNPLPFVSLLSLYLLYKAVQGKRLLLFLVVGFLLGIGLQLQYLALFLGTIVAVFTFIGTWYVTKKLDIFLLIKRYAIIFVGFLIGFSPFLAFEIRHGFPNLRTIYRYIFTDELLPVDYEGQSPLFIIFNVLFRLFGRLITRYPPPEQVNISIHPDILIWFVLTIVLILCSLFFFIKMRFSLAKILLSLWLILGIGLFGFYKDHIFDYHLGFIFFLPFLLVANAIKAIAEIKKAIVFKAISLLLLAVLIVFNILGNPFRDPPNRQKDQVKQIAEFVLSKADNKPFNFALITKGNSDHGYRYFMELRGRKPVAIESPQKDPERRSVTDQLLIVCEDMACQPLGHSLWEVAGFGRAEIVGEWPISVVKVYKLTHYQGEE